MILSKVGMCRYYVFILLFTILLLVVEFIACVSCGYTGLGISAAVGYFISGCIKIIVAMLLNVLTKIGPL